MTLIIENANVETLRVIESLKGFNKKLKITQEKHTSNEGECPICKTMDYKITPKLEKMIKKSLKEIQKERQKGTLKTYNDIDELRKALDS